MIVCRTIAELRGALRGPVGFVPTMGALHEGHLSLIRRARQDNDTVVVSIFVNPTQFAPHEDLSAYPRPIERDLALCDAERVDIVFAPPIEEVYPQPASTRVVVEGLTETMEGAFRKGHFDGVALVVTKLLNIVGACTAYFGEKDAQQLRVVRRMTEDLAMPVRIVACPTVRDADGLALSSRNAYLSPPERERALCLSRALRTVAALVEKGEREVGVLLARGREVLEPADSVDYLECVHPETLEPVATVDGPVLVLGAIRIGRTRLIDNVTI